MVGDYGWEPETEKDLEGFFARPNVTVSRPDPTRDTL